MEFIKTNCKKVVLSRITDIIVEENINIKYTLKEYEKKFGWTKDKEEEILDCVEEREEKMKQDMSLQEQENYSTIFFKKFIQYSVSIFCQITDSGFTFFSNSFDLS